MDASKFVVVPKPEYIQPFEDSITHKRVWVVSKTKIEEEIARGAIGKYLGEWARKAGVSAMKIPDSLPVDVVLELLPDGSVKERDLRGQK